MDRRASGEGRLKVRVVSVGRDRSGLFAPAVDEYASRLRHYTTFELIELTQAARRGTNASKSQEARLILERIGERDWLVALDEHGAAVSSLELCHYVKAALNQSRDLLFAVGGDEGLGAEVLAAAHRTLSLSRLTLPHRLARLVLVEQLYRAFTMLRGEPYAK